MNNKQAILDMDSAADAFYVSAIQIGIHPFIEFCGLMKEYINCCRDAEAQGINFAQCSAHTGQELPLAPHRQRYIAEKLNCIFGNRIGT